MNTRLETQTLQIEGWTLKVRRPEGDGPHPVLMLLHGWTGDEDVMWVFARNLPRRYLMIAPRGPDVAPIGGYAWHPVRAGQWPWVDDFRPAIDGLLSILTPEHFPGGDFTAPAWVGFSQGAAMIYSLALLHPGRVSLLAALSGFVPEGAEALGRNLPLAGKPVFVAHGTQDRLVDVGRAREGVAILEAAGAQVTYCEDDVGHKLSANCFHGLEKFFQYHTTKDGHAS